MSDITTNLCPAHDAIIYAVLAAFQFATLFNVTDLNIQIFSIFQKRSGIYFWSLLVASTGCGAIALAFLLDSFVRGMPWWLFSLINMFGWWSMVTGHSMVLWSRLHLVLVNRPFLLRAILAMIVVDAICLHIPTSILTWGYLSPDSAAWEPRYSVLEKVQLTIFVIQETIISGVYVKATLKLLNPTCKGRPRRVFIQLISVNLAVIAMDFVVLGMEYTDHWTIQANLKPFVYTLKLKLEFVVLNALVKNTKIGNATGLTGRLTHSSIATDMSSGLKNSILSEKNPLDTPSNANSNTSGRYDHDDKKHDDKKPDGGAQVLRKPAQEQHGSQPANKQASAQNKIVKSQTVSQNISGRPGYAQSEENSPV